MTKIGHSSVRQAAEVSGRESGGRCGFTLIEMLAVIAILGILAALAVPAVKNIGKSNVQISAGRQMMDAVARARQLALSQRTTVYMVFVPTNFAWTSSGPITPWWTSLTPAERSEVTNLIDRQLSGYAFLSYGHLGDQPGQHSWHYLSSWQSLPDGNFINPGKFANPNSFTIPQWVSDYQSQGGRPAVTNFCRSYSFPFPDENATNTQSGSPLLNLPCLAFDYTGRLISDFDVNGNLTDAYIPLAQGSVGYGYDGGTKTPQMTVVNASDITELPPGNSTGIGYNVVHVDHVTGRCTLEYFKMQ